MPCHQAQKEFPYARGPDAALARNDLVEKSAVLEFYRDNLITDPCLFNSIQVIDTSTRNRN